MFSIRFLGQKLTQRLITTTTKGSKTKFVTSIANKSMVENYIQCSSFITSCSHSNLHNDSPINEQQKQTKPAKTNTTDDTKISVTFTRPDGTKNLDTEQTMQGAFLSYLTIEGQHMIENHSHSSISSIVKELIDRWETMSPEQREYYINTARDDAD